VIVIIAPRDDFHAILARHVLHEQFGEGCEIIDLAAFPQSAELSLEIVTDRHRAQYRGEAEDIDWRDVSTVWWRRPQLHSPDDSKGTDDAEAAAFTDRECSSLVMSLFNESRPRVVNRPKEQLLAACKGTQLVSAARLSIPVPDTLITNSRDDADAFRSRHASCVFKALTWTNGPLIPTRTLTAEDLEDPDALQAAPVIVQEQLPAGSDIRVNIFGEEVYAAAKPVTTVDGRLEAQLWHEHSLPDALSGQLVELLAALGLDYGCVDLRLLPDGRYYFLEVNPAGQFLMVERDTKQLLTASLCRLLTA
jgi:glutathione synthase/RimK-type ligase-like ATP-grasp enzyme